MENLLIGDQVRQIDGSYAPVEALVVVQRAQRMYNLTIADAHTFFVGDAQWLVHNANCFHFLDPKTIRFTQDSIKSEFKNGQSVDELINALVSGKVKASDLPPIRIFEKDGKLYSLDNRRLYAFQQAGIPIPTVRATPEDVDREAWKFTTKNDGISIRVR